MAKKTVAELRIRNSPVKVASRIDGRKALAQVEKESSFLASMLFKLSATVDDEDVRHLHWLRNRIGDDLLDAIVITAGPQAYRRKDGIGVVPAACASAMYFPSTAGMDMLSIQ